MTPYQKAILIALAAVTAVAVTVAARSPRAERGPGDSAPPGARAIVVAELFTSEGCSSCPPADALLRELLAVQPVAGAEIIALGEHVDYWDGLGWRDPFSSSLFSARQSAYDAAVFKSNSIYTPQIVIDGALQGVGSDAVVVKRLIQSAARQAKGTVAVGVGSASAGAVQVELQIHMPSNVARSGPADIVIAVVEDGLATQVKNGENGGRTLAHSAVVRSMTTIGRLAGEDTTMTTTQMIPLASNWMRDHVRVIGLVQEQASRRMLAAGASPAGINDAE